MNCIDDVITTKPMSSNLSDFGAYSIACASKGDHVPCTRLPRITVEDAFAAVPADKIGSGMSAREDKVHVDFEILDDEVPAPPINAVAKATTSRFTAPCDTALKDEDPDFIQDDNIEPGSGSANIFNFGAGAKSIPGDDEIIVEDSEPRPENRPQLDLLRIHVKVANMVAMLPRSARLQKIYTRKLVSILSDFPHRHSAKAIERMLVQGASLEFIEECAQLKLHWESSPHLWLFMPVPRKNAIDNFIPRVSHANKLLNWTTAAHILETYPLTDALTLIETDWIEDWRKLHKVSGHKLERDAFSYQRFLRNRPSNFLMIDPEEWPYEEVTERLHHEEICITDKLGAPTWKFNLQAQTHY
jgi:hypothetical protein